MATNPFAKVLAGLAAGLSVRVACREAGVKVATAYKRQKADPVLAKRWRKGREVGKAERKKANDRRWKTSLPISTVCPKRCGGRLVCRTAKRSRLWTCRKCGWWSWRARVGQDCPECSGPMLWAHSRRSVVCLDCGQRFQVEPPADPQERLWAELQKFVGTVERLRRTSV